MGLSENSVLEMLSESEKAVFHYIKEEAQKGNSRIQESMRRIGEKLDLSEATVHRAVRKLRKQGVIGIVPSIEKAESNVLVYFGVPDPDKQAQDIFKMISQLSSNANRFETMLESKNQEIEQLKRDKAALYDEIAGLKERLKLGNIEESKVISSQPLGDGTVAYIIQTK